MSNRQLIALLRQMSGQENVLTIPRVYIRLLKSHRAALFLSQCVFWSDKGHRGDGWFYKSFREWREETNLHQHAIERIVVQLKKHGYLDTEIGRADGPSPITFYRPNLEKIAADIAGMDIAIPAKSTKPEVIRSSIPQSLTSNGADAQNGNPLNRYDGYKTHV